MEHKGTANIQTERLLLRRFNTDDAEMMYYNWANDERVTKFLPWLPYKSIEDVRHFIYLMIESYQNIDFYHWGKGITTEAMKSVISFLFNEVQFHRIVANFVNSNLH